VFFGRVFALLAVLVLLAGCAGGATSKQGQAGNVTLNQSTGGEPQNVSAGQNQTAGQQNQTDVQQNQTNQQQNQTSVQQNQTNQQQNQTNQQQNQTSQQVNQSVNQSIGSAIPSEKITFDSFGWTLHGTYYESADKEPDKAILLLPMLGNGRDTYPQSFVGRLHGEIPNAAVLALDLRGNGESTNLGNWQDFQLEDYRGMYGDVMNALKYLKQKRPTITEYYIVGASMGSTAGIMAAARSPTVIKVVMLSPGMNYRGVGISDAVSEYAHSMFVAACRDDLASAAAASQVYGLTSAIDKKLKIYECQAHGTDMFDATKSDVEPLESQLMMFLKK
jgi:pimeloyl-ACP methyl ester carboxylesterase